MSLPPITPEPQPSQDQPPGQVYGAPPVVPPRRRRRWPLIASVVGAAVVITLGVVIAGAAVLMPDATDTPTSAPTTSRARPAAAPPVAEPASAYDAPDPADWKITVKVLERKCFGSAGCNITYRIDPTCTCDLDPSKTYRVTYEVRGVEDGPAVGNFTVTGDTASLESEEQGQTTSSKAKLTAKVTDILED